MKYPTTRKFVVASLLTQMALVGSAYAGTVWDGGGGADTNINTAANWDGTAPGVVNALNGTAVASFGTGGSSATMNVDGFFTSVTFNRAGDFAIDGSSNLIVRSSNSGSTANLVVSSGAGANTFSINAPLQVGTNNGDTNKLLAINNNKAGSTLDINGALSRSTASSVNYSMRIQSVANSVTRFDGQVSNLVEIQQVSTANAWAGTLVFGGNQASTSASNITISSTNGPAATAALYLGESPSDVQSWGNVTLNHNMKLVVGGTVSIGTLTVGGSATTANTRIVGNSASNSSLAITSNSNSGATALVTIGGSGANENNIALVKSGTGTLTISNGGNTYSGGTTLVHGGGFGSFGLALGANNALGTGPLVIGTAATGSNGARFRMAGFDQTVSALSSGSVGTRLIENAGADQGILTVNQSTNTDFSAILRDRTSANAAHTGALSLVKSGVGTLVLSGTSNTYTGTTTLTDGVLEVASLGNAGLARNVTTTAGSAVVSVDSTAGLVEGMTFSAATLPAGAMIVSIDGPTQITISDSSTATGTSVAASFGSTSSLGLATSSSGLVFDGGVLRYNGGTTSSNRGFTINNGKIAGIDIASGSAIATFSGTSGVSTGGLNKLGAGTLVLGGTHGYTGSTTVSGGILALGGDNRIDAASALVLAGGALDTAGFSQSFGSLDLNANASISLGASNSISFANSAGQDWGSFSLNFTSLGGSFAANSVRFGTSSSGLTAGQLGLITVDGVGGYSLDTSGYLTAVPEPSAFAAAAGLGALGAALRRRRRAG